MRHPFLTLVLGLVVLMTAGTLRGADGLRVRAGSAAIDGGDRIARPLQRAREILAHTLIVFGEEDAVHDRPSMATALKICLGQPAIDR